MPFSTFLGFCKHQTPSNGDPCNSFSVSKRRGTDETEIGQGDIQSEKPAPEQLYLAQVAS